MRHTTVVEQIRRLVQKNLQELEISTAAEVEETILIRNGFYCGRRFSTPGAHAIWFCEENQLKFYGEQGTVLRVIQHVDQQLAAAQFSSAPLADAA